MLDLILPALMAATTVSSAKPLTTGEKRWNAGSRGEYCHVSHTAPPIPLLIFRNNDAVFNFSFTSDKSRSIRYGQSVDLKLVFASHNWRSEDISVRFSDVSEDSTKTQFMGQMPVRYFGYFRKATVLFAYYGDTLVERFELNGSAAAIDALQRCASRESDPFN